MGAVNRYHRRYCASDRWKARVQGVLLPWALDGIELGPDVLEVGPGPGLTTDVLQGDGRRVTAAELDPGLAGRLAARTGPGVAVCRADATALPFAGGSFSGAACLTMLHHVPSAPLQDRILAEVHRVLRPGGWFAGSDSRISLRFRLVHLFDTMVVVDPDGFGARLAAAGFEDVHVEPGERSFRFRGRRPGRP